MICFLKTEEHIITVPFNRFVCHRWLDTNEEDGKIELDLRPSEVKEKTPGKSLNVGVEEIINVLFTQLFHMKSLFLLVTSLALVQMLKYSFKSMV